jgi:ubiquinone/menaquinone biosynthesis C-methylase UbiE
VNKRRYIHGQTDPREVIRLEKQARFVAPWSLRDFDAAPGDRVLDLATGVGAMAAQLVQRFPGIHLFGVDLNRSQLRHARSNHPIAFYLQADATRLPFPEQSFDRIHCSWLLEHLPHPLQVLKEVRRVLKTGGYCQFIEVDNASFRTAPEYPEVMRAMSALNEAQQKSGGDPFVGRRLAELFREAGFEQIDVRPRPLVGSAADPAFFRAFVEEFAEIFESLDEALGPAMTATIRAAAQRLRELPALARSEIHYRPIIARATR